MYQVRVSSIEEYLTFDPVREGDLRRIDAVIRDAAPHLDRWFVPGAAAGKPGMRMTMIGYGSFRYRVKASAEPIKWPVIGMALQKNYVSLYCSARIAGGPFVRRYADQLGHINYSPTGVIRFQSADDIDCDCLRRMIEDLDQAVRSQSVTLQYRSTTRNL